MEQIIITHTDGTTMSLQTRSSSSKITKATQSVELLNTDTIDISVESAKKMRFEIGDKITVIGRDYTMNTPAKETKLSTNNYRYDIQFEGAQYDLARATYDVNIDTTGADVQGDSLTADMKTFLDILIANIGRVLPGKWVLGTYPAGTEVMTLTFGEADNCLSVLQTLCQKYNQEFDIAIAVNGVRTLNIGQAGRTFGFTFQHGKGKGIFELTREKVTSSNIVNRLKVYGSTKNITSKYRATRLLLPGKTKAQSFIEDAASIAKYGVWENTKIFEEIFPNRIGTVSALGDSVLKFVDSSMNFDLNEKEADGVTTKYLMAGTAAKIKFNTGNLAGYEFDLHSYDHATKTFIIVSQTDERDMTFPSSSSAAFQISIGDKYIIKDIGLPQAYEDTAEADLQTEGSGYLAQNCQPKVQYGLTVDQFFLKSIVGANSQSNIFWPGDYIPIQDADIEVDKLIRLKKFDRNLLADFDYALTISDISVTRTIYSRIISELRDIDKTIVINNLKDPARARRNYLSSQELLNKVFDTEGDFYSDKIKPLSIDTSMLSVGAKSMQFGLEGTVFQPNYGANKNRIVYKGGILTHYAIMGSGGNPRTWTLTDGDVTLSTDDAYYVYAKCERTGSGGVILISTSKISVESDGSYYHFLLGVVNSVDVATSTRALALMYGFSTINGRYIRTGRIQSADGSTYFDLDTGTLNGKITFTAGSSGLTNLSEWAGAAQDIQDAQSTANQGVQAAANAQSFIDNTLPPQIAALQAQIDGQVENWFYPYVPSLINYPAIEWTTAALKNQHTGDTFTNTQEFVDEATTPDAGKAWRFINTAGVYSWTPIADSDAVKALLAASKAQDTADGKRRVFVVQPTTPYDVGDLWMPGTSAPAKKCDVARLTGAFVPTDWSKADNSTDDTAVNNLQIGGRNYFSNSEINSLTGWNPYNTVLTIVDGSLRMVGTGQYVGANTGYTKTMDAQKEVTISFFAKNNKSSECALGLFPNGNGVIYIGTLPANSGWVKLSKTFIPAPVQVDKVNATGTHIYSDGDIDLQIKQIKIEYGNKATDWTPAPEDVAADATAKANAAQATAEAYALAKANLAETTAKAYADGVVTEEETRAIADATAKANAAKDAAIAAAALDATAKAAAAQAAAETYALAKANLAEVTAKAYADGIVTEEETRAIADATAKASAAQATAISTAAADAAARVNAVAIGGRNYFANSEIKSIVGWGAYNSVLSIVDSSLKILGDASYLGVWKDYTTPLDAQRQVTISFFAKNNKSAAIYIQGWPNGNGTINFGSVPGNSGWVKLSCTFLPHIYQVDKVNTNGIYIFINGDGDTDFQIKQIKAELGNKATDWTPAIEELDSKIAAAKATADEAAAVTQGFTAITGGLVTTNLIKLKDALSAAETAGINGLMGTGDNPAFYAGGTYAQALQALAAIILRHNGSAKIGDLLIDQNGVVRILDPVTGKERFMLNAAELTPLATLLDSAQITGSQWNSGVSLTDNGSSTRPNTLTVTQANSKLSLVGGWSISALAPTTGTALVYAHIYILKDGAFYTSVKSVNLTLNVNNSSEEIIEAINFSLSSVPVGVYSLAVALSISEDGSTDTDVNLTLDESTISFVFEKDIKQVRFGTDGQMIFYAADKYFYLTSKTGGPFIKSRGEWDIPGLRGSASIASNGVANKTYGIAIASELTSAGLYTITHNIGHTDYSVGLTVINASGRINAVVTAKNANNFTVRIVNVYTDALTSSAFDLKISANG